MVGPTVASKVWDVYAAAQRIFKSPNDLEVSGVRLNSSLTLCLLGFLTKSAVLILGSPGSGKTTLAEVLGCMLGGIPFPALVSTVIRGAPEATDEKLVGRLDLGRLQSGEEEVIFSSFTKSPVHIVDELNRIPTIKQAILLEGVRTGKWLYLGQLLPKGKTPFFATCNFEDRGAGTFPLIPALADRFSVAVESGYPGLRIALEIAATDTEAAIEAAGLCHYAEEAMLLLNSKKYDPQAIVSLSEQFKCHLAERGVPTLTEAQLDQAWQEIHAMPFGDGSGVDLSSETGRFLAFLITCLNFCARTGAKRGDQFGETAKTECPTDCRFKVLACGTVQGGGSRRQERDLVIWSRALAWLLGEPRADAAHVKAVTPYVLWHRRAFSPDLLAKTDLGRRTHPVALEAAHRWVDRAWREFAELQPRFAELQAQLTADQITLGRQTALRIEELHPVLQDLARSFGRRR